jgi:DNA-directed RNA polymerase specialized sigma24 family protein
VPPQNGCNIALQANPAPKGRQPISEEVFMAWMVLAIRAFAVPSVFRYRHWLLSADAILDALAKAWSTWTYNPAYFTSPAHLRSWLKQTAFWAMVDWHRRDQRCRLQILPAEISRDLPDPLSSRRKRDRWTPADQEAVWACIQQLPSTERLLLEGYYYDKLTDVEMAKRLYHLPDASPAEGLRVWRLRQKALAHLRKLLQQEGVG